MKIKLMDLRPNPFRDYDNYPINQEKVESLVNSIEQTGFWDNVLARKADGAFELAYGLHRFIALEQLYAPDHEIDIPVKELDDATMLRIMAHENDEYWGATPKIIDETIRVTKKFLEEHPEIVKEVAPSGTTPGKIGRSVIAKFLGDNWNERRIQSSLERLGLIEKEKLDKEAVESMPTDGAARTFASAVKSMKGITPAQQRRAAKRIVESEDYSLAGIKGALLDQKYKKKDKAEKDLIRLDDFIAECSRDIGKLNLKIEALIKLKQEIGSEISVKALEMAEFKIQTKILIDNLSQLWRGSDVESELLQISD